MPIIIREKSTGTPLAQAEIGPRLLKYEGNWYFDAALVNNGVLTVTERTYTCPYKGTCNWVNFVNPSGKRVEDIAWVYPSPKPGHESIARRFGFYAGAKGGTLQEG